MEAYRDQYATLFKNGRNVVSIGVSADPDTTLAAWAREKDFPVLFGSDPGGKASSLYNSFNPKFGMDSRDIFVIGPDGRITYVARRFNVLSQEAYAALAAAVDGATPKTGETH